MEITKYVENYKKQKEESERTDAAKKRRLQQLAKEPKICCCVNRHCSAFRQVVDQGPRTRCGECGSVIEELFARAVWSCTGKSYNWTCTKFGIAAEGKFCTNCGCQLVPRLPEGSVS